MISQDAECKLCHETVPLIRHIELQSVEIIRLKEQSRHLTNERNQLKRQIDEIGLTWDAAQ